MDPSDLILTLVLVALRKHIHTHEIDIPSAVGEWLNGRDLGDILVEEVSLHPLFPPLRAVPFLQVVDQPDVVSFMPQLGDHDVAHVSGILLDHSSVASGAKLLNHQVERVVHQAMALKVLAVGTELLIHLEDVLDVEIHEGDALLVVGVLNA